MLEVYNTFHDPTDFADRLPGVIGNSAKDFTLIETIIMHTKIWRRQRRLIHFTDKISDIP